MPTRIPGVSYAAAPSAEASAKVLAWPPKLIVIHDTGNPTSTKENEASYAHTRPVKGATSAHAYVDNGGVLGSLRLDRQAWAAYTYANANGLHIEMCLRGDRAATRQITAGLVRQLCQMTSIPMVKLSPLQVAAGARGVCGHRDITVGLGVGDHSDPGADFPWAQFMAWVNQAATAATPGGTVTFTLDDLHKSPNGGSDPARAIASCIVQGFDQSTYEFEPTAQRFPGSLAAAVKRQEALLLAIAAKVDIDATELAAIQESARAGAAAALASAADSIIARIRDEIGGVSGSAELDTDELEAALRRVFADAGQA